MVRHVLGLLTTPKWEMLLKDEICFSFRMAAPMPEYLVLFRVSKESAGERRGEFRKLFAGIAELSQGFLMLTDSSRRGAELSRLEVPAMPVGLTVASKENLVALSTSDGLLDACLELMDSKDYAGSIAKDQRFAAGFEGLGDGRNGQVFLDLPGEMGFLSNVLGMVAGGMQGNQDMAGIFSILKTVIEEVGRIGPITSVDRVEGDQMVTSTKVAFVQGDRPGFIEGLVRDREPLPDVLRAVPKNALAFHVTSGVDLLKIHDALVGLLRERLPRGPAALEHWDRIQKRIGFNLRDDLLSLIEGTMGWVVFPREPAGTGTESLFFMRVRNGEKLKEMIRKCANKVKDYVTGRGQEMEFAEIPEWRNEFREVRVPAFSCFRPVIGFPSDDIFLIGSSVGCANRIRATMGGNEPNFTENPAFKALQMPDGPVMQISYRNLQGSLKCLADCTAAVGFVASVLPANHDTRHARKLGAILTKLSKFLRDVDIAVDEGSWVRYDPEKHAIFSRQMARPRGEPKKL